MQYPTLAEFFVKLLFWIVNWEFPDKITPPFSYAEFLENEQSTIEISELESKYIPAPPEEA